MGQSADTIKALVTEGAACKKELNKLADKKKKLENTLAEKTKALAELAKPHADRVEEINAQLLELGAGDYFGDHGELAKVIAPAATLKPTNEEIEASRLIVGDFFDKLIAETRTVTYAPNKSFRGIAEALLSPEDAAKVIKLFEKPSTPYVKWAN
jgi:hypothetical protein